jgi:hypothetical protein
MSWVVAAQLAKQAQRVLWGRPELDGVGEEALAGIGSQREGFERQVEGPRDGVVAELTPMVWIRTLWAAQRTRNSSLWVDGSPIRSDNCG